MKTGPLWQIAVATTHEAEEAVAALLERLFGQRASIYTNQETGETTVTVFTPRGRESSAAKRDALTIGLQFIKDCGLDIGKATITAGRVPREDWAEAWKKYFKTIEIGETLLIRPSWSRKRPRKGQAVVVLDPGLSFGTGQHPTTEFCLDQLVRFRRSGEKQSFLDVGSGSGILAISAVKLGYEPVIAFDFDRQAIKTAKANARRNRVAPSITLQNLTRLPVEGAARYDIICANLVSDLLIAERERLLNRLAPNGRIVLAGILKTQFAELRSAYEEAGLSLITTKAEGEWQSGAFARPE